MRSFGFIFVENNCALVSLIFFVELRSAYITTRKFEGRRMYPFLQKFRGNIKGVISGFDRIVLKGCFRQ